MEKKVCEFYEKDNKKVVKGLGFLEGSKINNLKELIDITKEKYGNKVAFRYRENRKIIEKSYNDFASDIDCFGTALCTKDLKGKRIAIIAENRYEWAVSYLSIVNGTGVAVPLDKHLPENEIENLLERADCEAIIFSKKYKEYMENIAKTNSKIKLFICMDDIILDKDKKFVTMTYMMEVGIKALIKNNKTFTGNTINNEELAVLDLKKTNLKNFDVYDINISEPILVKLPNNIEKITGNDDFIMLEVKNKKNINLNTTCDIIERDKALEKLLEEGKTFKEASKIISNQER